MARTLSGLARRVAAAQSADWAICAAARERIAGGADIVMLGPGVPDLPSPAVAVEAGRAALAAGRTRYANLQGEPALREAVARRHARSTGLTVDPADVIVTAGAQHGILSCLLAVAGPGDRVAVVTPHYPAYGAAIAAAGAAMAAMALGTGPAYALDAASMPQGDLSALVLCNPHNPTGRVFTPSELGDLARSCRDRDLWVVSDEVYAGLAFDAPHVPVAGLTGMGERTFTLGSLSKSHAMSGWRCGWIVAPPGMGRLLQPLVASGSMGIPPFVQDAAVAVLRAGPAAEAESRAEYGRRRHALLGGLSGIPGLRLSVPEGGIFALVDVSGTGRDGRGFAWEMLEAGVCVIPGDAFGAPGTVRVALSEPVERIALACRRMAAALRPGRGPAGAAAVEPAQAPTRGV